MDLIGPYTLKGKDGPEIDFMCVTMIDQATSWIEIVNLLVAEINLVISMDTKGRNGTNTLLEVFLLFGQQSRLQILYQAVTAYLS